MGILFRSSMRAVYVRGEESANEIKSAEP
jgi:hypothetical protein